MKYYSLKGQYIGGFTTKPNADAVEVISPPPFVDCLWENNAWKIPIETAQKATKIEIYGFATQCRATLTEHADQYKLAGWVKKAARAERMAAGNENDEDIAVLQAECDKRGADETPEALAQKQLKKSKGLDMAIAVIDGLESAALTQIEQCTSIEEIEACLQELKNQAEQELSNLTGENT